MSQWFQMKKQQSFEYLSRFLIYENIIFKSKVKIENIVAVKLNLKTENFLMKYMFLKEKVRYTFFILQMKKELS